MDLRRWGRTASILLIAGGVLAMRTPALADIVTGTFAGVATSGSFLTSGGSVDVSGSPVTGSFDLRSVTGATPLSGTPAGEFLLPQGSVSYSFFISAINQTTSFGQPGSNTGSALLELGDNGLTQTLLLDAAFVNPSVITSLELTGPEGSLFSSVTDVNSVQAGAGVSLVSPITLAIRFQGSASVAVTSTAIPEPASWPLLAGSVAVAAGMRGRRNSISKDGLTDFGKIEGVSSCFTRAA